MVDLEEIRKCTDDVGAVRSKQTLLSGVPEVATVMNWYFLHTMRYKRVHNK